MAQEVKALASQTTGATEVIGAQVTAVQQATASMSGAIASIRTTIAALNELAQVIGCGIQDQIQVRRDLETGMHTVSASAQAITASMGMIANATESVDKWTQNVKLASRELT